MRTGAGSACRRPARSPIPRRKTCSRSSAPISARATRSGWKLTGSWFKLKGKNNYHYVAGNRALGHHRHRRARSAAGQGGINVLRPDFNEFKQAALNYSHKDLFGGTFLATAYFARQRMRFPGDNSADRQDPLIAPLGTLVDQSEINSKKYGLRTSYSHEDFLIDGLELRFGVDAVHDTTEQRLALTDRVWVPPLKYTSFGPYAQLSWDIGPVTLSGGVRHEDRPGAGRRLYDDLLPQPPLRDGRYAQVQEHLAQRRRHRAGWAAGSRCSGPIQRASRCRTSASRCGTSTRRARASRAFSTCRP